MAFWLVLELATLLGSLLGTLLVMLLQTWYLRRGMCGHAKLPTKNNIIHRFVSLETFD